MVPPVGYRGTHAPRAARRRTAQSRGVCFALRPMAMGQGRGCQQSGSGTGTAGAARRGARRALVGENLYEMFSYARNKKGIGPDWCP